MVTNPTSKNNKYYNIPQYDLNNIYKQQEEEEAIKLLRDELKIKEKFHKEQELTQIKEKPIEKPKVNIKLKPNNKNKHSEIKLTNYDPFKTQVRISNKSLAKDFIEVK
jgi:hypothetical protein